jgi:hypothetical protein
MFARYLIRLLWFSFIFSSLLMSCTPQTGLPAPTPTESLPIVTATPGKMDMSPVMARPDYVSYVSPEEYTIVPIGPYNQGADALGHGDLFWGYQSNICITLDLGPLVQTGDVLIEDREIASRIELLVDERAQTWRPEESLNQAVAGSKLDDETTSWSGPLIYCWDAPLDPGRHEVTFKFRQTSGDIQEYTWHFEIVE